MPFCPKCKCEYKVGITECSDCKVPLVDYLSIEDEQISNEQSEALAYQTLAEGLGLDEMSEEDVKPIHAYQNKKDKAEDFKSSAYTLIIVGVLGIVCLLLIEFNIIPIVLYAPGKYISYGVMGALFVIFIIAGIRSFSSSKKYEFEASAEDENTKAIMEYALNNLTKEKIIELASIDENIPEEMKYFKYSEIIKNSIISQFGEQDLSFLESICDDIYGKIFE